VAVGRFPVTRGLDTVMRLPRIGARHFVCAIARFVQKGWARPVRLP